MPRLPTGAGLEATSVVANRTMNRGRGLHGVNSYTRELGTDPLTRLHGRPRPA
jgi:hypothetical protein